MEKEAVDIKPDGDLLAFCHKPRTRQEIEAFLGIETVVYAFNHYVLPLLAANKLVIIMPEKPPKKKYYSVL